MGSTIDGSSFSGLLTRVEIGHIRIGSAGNGRIKSRGSGINAEPTSVVAGGQDQRHGRDSKIFGESEFRPRECRKGNQAEPPDKPRSFS